MGLMVYMVWLVMVMERVLYYVVLPWGVGLM